jgi:ABC-type multidrug transport system fused ATPase/permease subunit
MSFLGLGTLITGLSILFGILLDTGTSLTASVGWWRNQLALSLALLLVGLPLWLYYWNGILKRVQSGGITEWRALSRRIYLYVIIGASIIMLAGDLVNIVYQLLSGIMQGNFGTNFLHSSKWSLQTLIVAVLLLWYHWQILRADQRRGAEAVVVRKSVTLLADDRTGELAARLENKLGFKIRTLYQVGQTGGGLIILPEEEIDRLVNEILSVPSNKVMLVVLSGKVTVLPYQDKYYTTQ